MLDKIFELLKNNLKNPKLYVGLFLLLVIGLLLFPYIDANYFYYGRVERRIDILEKMAKIDKSTLEENIVLKNEYNSILKEISKQKNGSIGNIFITENTKAIQKNKFISGGILLWIVGLICLFVKMERYWYKFLGLVLFGLFGAIAGYISMILPTVISPKCNYIVMPFLQLILFGILVTGGDKN